LIKSFIKNIIFILNYTNHISKKNGSFYFILFKKQDVSPRLQI
jgi:hypothetical protein